MKKLLLSVVMLLAMTGFAMAESHHPAHHHHHHHHPHHRPVHH